MYICVMGMSILPFQIVLMFWWENTSLLNYDDVINYIANDIISLSQNYK